MFVPQLEVLVGSSEVRVLAVEAALDGSPSFFGASASVLFEAGLDSPAKAPGLLAAVVSVPAKGASSVHKALGFH